MQENHIIVPKTARYFTLGTANENTREVWFVLHGYGQLASYFIQNFQAVEDDSRLIVAPEGLSRFYLTGFTGRIGATWMTSEDRLNEIRDYLEYLNALHDHIFESLDRRKINVTVLGFSQGTATACRWVAKGTVQTERLVLWAGLMPPELDFPTEGEIFRRLQLFFVLGNKDPFANPEFIAKQEKILETFQISFQLLTFNGEHELDAETLKTLAKI